MFEILCKDLMNKMEKTFSPKQLKDISNYCWYEEKIGYYVFFTDKDGYNIIVNTRVLEILSWIENDADFGSAFYTGKNLKRFLENLKEDIF